MDWKMIYQAASRLPKLVSWALVCQFGAAIAAEEPDFAEVQRFVRENKDKFPLIKPGRGESALAKVHTLAAQPTPLGFGQRYYNGFRFDAPDWLDAEIIWLHGRPEKPGVSFYHWHILPEDPSEPLPPPLNYFTHDISDRFPFAQEAFPGALIFQQQILKPGIVKPGKRYIIWFGFRDKERTELRYSMTVNSRRGMVDWGMLPTGPASVGPSLAHASTPPAPAKDPKLTAREALATFEKSGPAATEAFLDREIDTYIKSGSVYAKFHEQLWMALKDEKTRKNFAWQAFGYDWLQRTHVKLGANILATDVCYNHSIAQSRLRKPGAARQALVPFYDSMAERNIPLDPFELKDMGPYLDELPMIRRREAPLCKKPLAVAITHSGAAFKQPGLPRSVALGLRAIGELEAAGGDWKRAIERFLWVRALVEDASLQLYESADNWFASTYMIASTLHTVGLGENAETVISEFQANKAKEGYQNRMHLLTRLLALEIRIDHGSAGEPMLAELDSLHRDISGNRHLDKLHCENVLIAKARCLAALGRTAEADGLLDGLVENEKNETARIERIAMRIAAGRLEGMEGELLAALANRREWGLKMEEVRLYSLYADLLEKSGRTADALAARRETLRLIQAFDLFAKRPLELAKLSRLLGRCGDKQGAEAAAGEARKLAAGPHLPARVGKLTETLLADAEKDKVTPSKDAITSLQPVEAMVLPIAGMPLRGRLTVANPGHQRVHGKIGFAGLPVAATWDGATVTAVIGESGASVVDISVSPGSYATIALESVVPPPTGKLVVGWRVPGQPDQTSKWTFESGEEGVPAAVVDAGVYRRNAFFGIPVFHHYQHASPDAANASLRVVATPGCRVELYDGASRPISIDVDGDGAFAGVGEDYFHDPDGDGRADFPLDKGAGIIHIQAFPPADLPATGLRLSLQSWTGNEWAVVAESRIEP